MSSVIIEMIPNKQKHWGEREREKKIVLRKHMTIGNNNNKSIDELINVKTIYSYTNVIHCGCLPRIVL